MRGCSSRRSQRQETSEKWQAATRLTVPPQFLMISVSRRTRKTAREQSVITLLTLRRHHPLPQGRFLRRSARGSGIARAAPRAPAVANSVLDRKKYLGISPLRGIPYTCYFFFLIYEVDRASGMTPHASVWTP